MLADLYVECGYNSPDNQWNFYDDEVHSGTWNRTVKGTYNTPAVKLWCATGVGCEIELSHCTEINATYTMTDVKVKVTDFTKTDDGRIILGESRWVVMPLQGH